MLPTTPSDVTATRGEDRRPVPRAARLVAEPLAATWTAAEAALALRGDPHPVALVGAWAGGGAVLASEPVRVARPDEDPFAVLDEQPEVLGAEAHPDAVGGGWMGMLGYALGGLVEELPPPPPPRTALPPFALAFYDHVLRLDAAGTWWFEALETPERAAALAARRQRLAALAPGRPQAFSAGPFASVPPGTAGLAEGVRECVERIHAGELFQANLTLRLEGAFAGDPLDAFAAGLELEPALGAFVAGPWGATVGLSPELFLRRRGREVTTRPIKGTAPRAAGAAALTGSPKDRAENVMIVDLMRNDLGRVCAYGSVHAAPEPVAEAHPGLWHLVSEVRGRLRDDVGDAALLRATFPPGSVTGAPKVQAQRVISELEGVARHAYTGAVGFASPVAGLELNVAIRTFELRDGVAWLGAGGGIVADSDPEAEVREALAKATPLVAALGAELRARPARGARLPRARALEGGLTRPDPALGLFETVAVRGGTAVDLEPHLERLRAGAAVALGVELPAGLAERVRQAAGAAEADPSRLRIDVAGDGTVDVTVRPAAPWSSESVAVVPVLLPGGFGAYKWRDRRLMDALAERHGALPLLVDADGAVLEAAIANVWTLEGDALVTPPADGRLLAGVTRARGLALLPGAREEPLDLDRLAEADAVLLTGSVALMRPVSGYGAVDPAWLDRMRALLGDVRTPWQDLRRH